MQKDLGRYLFYFLYKLQKRAFEPKRSRSSLSGSKIGLSWFWIIVKKRTFLNGNYTKMWRRSGGKKLAS